MVQISSMQVEENAQFQQINEKFDYTFDLSDELLGLHFQVACIW